MNSPNLESIERVLRSGRLLLRLINDSFEISRYDAGKMRLQPEPLDVRSLTQAIVEMIEPLARSKGLTLTVDCDRAPQQVMTDQLRLQQILTNRLSNATRHTEAGTILLTCWQISEQQWAIAVADSGIGIDADAQTHVFDPYFRVETATQSRMVPG